MEELQPTDTIDSFQFYTVSMSKTQITRSRTCDINLSVFMSV